MFFCQCLSAAPISPLFADSPCTNLTFPSLAPPVLLVSRYYCSCHVSELYFICFYLSRSNSRLPFSCIVFLLIIGFSFSITLHSRLDRSFCSAVFTALWVSIYLLRGRHPTWDVSIQVASLHFHAQSHTWLYFWKTLLSSSELQPPIESDQFVRCCNILNENRITLIAPDESWKCRPTSGIREVCGETRW